MCSLYVHASKYRGFFKKRNSAHHSVIRKGRREVQIDITVYTPHQKVGQIVNHLCKSLISASNKSPFVYMTE